MPHDEPRAPAPPALDSLHRAFAMALSSVKLNSAGQANAELKKARNEKKKKEILEVHFTKWREGSGDAIRKFFPQYIDLALAYPDQTGTEVIKWAEEKAWIPLYGQCGVRKDDECSPEQHPSDSVIWWLAVAIDGNMRVNVLGEPHWCAPKWLAASRSKSDKLIAEWSRRLSARFVGVLDEEMEAARVRVAIAASSRSSINALTIEQVAADASIFTWKELENRFRGIQSKAPVQHKVEAWFTLTESHAGAVTEEWRVLGDAPCKVEFENLASIASRKLGYTASEDATECWLGRVREWMRQEKLDKCKEWVWLPTGYSDFEGHRDTVKYLYTDRIADLSAMFCMELIARGTPESAVSEIPGQIAAVSKTAIRRGKRILTRWEMKKRMVIFGAIQAGFKGRKYCKLLDERSLRIPIEWKEDGCPDTYTKAYESECWQKRIQDEKCRYRERFDTTPASERKAIIEGETGTRRTR